MVPSNTSTSSSSAIKSGEVLGGVISNKKKEMINKKL
jgi:hypothetical protein